MTHWEEFYKEQVVWPAYVAM